MHMRNPVLSKTICWLLLVCFPVAMNAMPPQATVQAQGSVTVNGKAVSATSTLFQGDKIQTAADGAATLSSQGVMVQMEPNTTAVFSERAFDLGCGSATVVTSAGTMVRVAGITVTQASPNTTKIQVSQVNGAIKVTARDNWAAVNDGHLRQTLAPGQTVTFSRPGATCEITAHAVAPTRNYYLPAALVTGGAFVLTYCAINGWCSEASPAGP